MENTFNTSILKDKYPKLSKRDKKKPSLLNKKFKMFLISGLLGWFIYLFGAITDNIFAGNFLGAEALAAVEVVAPFYSFIAFIGYLLSAGCAIKFSHYVGAGENKRANQLFGLGVVFSFIFGIITALALFLFKDAFLGMFNLSRGIDGAMGVYEYASDYYDWFIGVGLIYPTYMIVYRMVSEDGDSLFPVLGDAGQMIVNMVFSVVLVQKIGIKGLGIGTFLSICTTLLFVCLHFFRKTNSIKPAFKFSMKDIKDMLYLGTGNSLNCFYVATLDIIMNFFIARKFGDSYLVPYGMINFSINFTELFLCAVTSATPFITTGFGSRNKEDIRFGIQKGVKATNIFCLVCTFVVGGLCTVIPRAYGIPTDLIVDGQNLFTMACVAQLLISITFILYGNQYMICGYYNGKGIPIYSIVSNSLSGLFVPIILCILLSYTSLGFYGLIIGFAVTPIISFATIYIMVKAKYKNKHIYVYDKYDEKQFSYDEYLDNDSIALIRDSVEAKLRELNVEEVTILKVMASIEDTLTMIYQKNLEDNPEKRVLNRLTVCVGEKMVRLLNKNDGKIFDLVEYHKKQSENNNYLILKGISKNGKFSSGIMLSFNSHTVEIAR